MYAKTKLHMDSGWVAAVTIYLMVVTQYISNIHGIVSFYEYLHIIFVTTELMYTQLI